MHWLATGSFSRQDFTPQTQEESLSINDRELCRADRVDRVIIFGEDNAADFEAASKAAQGFTRLRAIQGALTKAKVGQQIPTGRTALEVLFEALRLDLQNMARTARPIALEQPGFADAFRLPDVPTDGNLLTIADAFIDRLAAKPDDDTATKARKAAMVPNSSPTNSPPTSRATSRLTCKSHPRRTKSP